MTPEAVRAALEAAIAAFLRALPTGNGYSPHDLAAAVISDSRDEAAALRAERDALKRDNAFLGYVIHGPLEPEQEARATKVERDALRADNERLRATLEYTREEMREACRNNYRAGQQHSADLAERERLTVAQIAAIIQRWQSQPLTTSEISDGAAREIAAATPEPPA